MSGLFPFLSFFFVSVLLFPVDILRIHIALSSYHSIFCFSGAFLSYQVRVTSLFLFISLSLLQLSSGFAGLVNVPIFVPTTFGVALLNLLADVFAIHASLPRS